MTLCCTAFPHPQEATAAHEPIAIDIWGARRLAEHTSHHNGDGTFTLGERVVNLRE